jgi:hypothetical protein
MRSAVAPATSVTKTVTGPRAARRPLDPPAPRTPCARCGASEWSWIGTRAYGETVREHWRCLPCWRGHPERHAARVTRKEGNDDVSAVS